MGLGSGERRRRETEGGVFWPRGLTLSRLLRMVEDLNDVNCINTDPGMNVYVHLPS